MPQPSDPSENCHFSKCILVVERQDGSKEANTLRAERGFNVPPGKSRRGEPYGQTIGSI
jgi:hypothetical protein